MLGDAIRWVEQSEDARRSALAEVGLDDADAALPDVLAADPTRMVDAMKALVIEAVRRDAPEGVVEALIVPVRRMAETARELDAYRYTTDVLAGLRGLRDATELEPPLARALAAAPDDANRDRLERMLERVRNPIDPAQAQIAADAVTLPTKLTGGEVACFVCCLAGCSLCGINCLLCCNVNCFLCG
jgi:hypothetical protein